MGLFSTVKIGFTLRYTLVWPQLQTKVDFMLGTRDLEHTVAVLFGGRSSEHEISLRSAIFVLKNMPEKYRIIPVGISRGGEFLSVEGTFTAGDFNHCEPADLAVICEGRMPRSLAHGSIVPSLFLPFRADAISHLPESPVRILNLEASVVFPVLHGPNGEDGRWQGVFELAEMAYVGCDIRASVIGIDKNIQKIMARDAGIPVAKYEVIEQEDWFENRDSIVARIEKNIGYPNFVKPNALGSAVGVNRATNAAELVAALKSALKFDDKALVEEPMVGTEVECAFLGSGVNPRITVAGEIATKDFYSYEAKYLTDDGAAQFIPARLDAGRMQELRAMAAKLAKVFSLSGLCRLDFWNCSQPNRFVFNEINTLPGLTSISMFPKLWEHEGVSGKAWIGELIMRAQTRRDLAIERIFGIKDEPND